MTAPAGAIARTGGRAAAGALRGRRWPWGSPSGLAWLVAIASLAFFATAQYCKQLYVDTYFDLYAGRYIAEHGIPHRNVVTLTAHGTPWVDQQWLAQLISYRAWQLGGYAGVVSLDIAVVAIGMAVLGALMLRRGTPPLWMCVWTLAALAVSYGYATPRAQSWGYLFMPLLLWLVLSDGDGTRPRAHVWLAIPLLAVWANMHGSVLLGAGFVALHAVWRGWSAARCRDQRGEACYVLLGVGAVASVFCTPYGLRVVGYYSSLIGNTELARGGSEWAPPNPAAPDSWAFFTVVIAVAAAVVIAWRRGVRPQPELAAFGVVALAVALMAFRNTPWFGLVGCLLAADMVAGRSAAPALAAFFRRALAAALAVCAVLAAVTLARDPASEYEAWMPRSAVDVAARIATAHPGMPVLSDQWAAAGLLWLHPALLGRVAFDVRAEQYSQAQLTEFFNFLFATAPGWQRLLHGYDLVVVSRQWHPRLADAMSRMPSWRVVYTDTSGVVLERVR